MPPQDDQAITQLPFRVGVVAIGRNEGQRLERCLRSACGTGAAMVYVDSGSTDGSVEMARSLGVMVVELDMSLPFTMARARNEGLRRLLESQPGPELVQFVDGDCELDPTWLATACGAMAERAGLVAVCGRRLERHRSASLYHRLIDMEWDTPIGPARSCHGDVMMRVEALQSVGGFNANMIAGEEPELCVRLRARGGKILRVDAPMTMHDAAMTRFGQWWKRAVRCGHANAHGAHLHASTLEPQLLKPLRSAALWGMLVPVAALAGLVAAWWIPAFAIGAALVAIAYFALAWRIYRWRRPRDTRGDAVLYAAFCIVAKAPECIGIARFHLNRLRGRRSELIEYKTAQEAQ